jgi:peptide/nickel transport system permease protein
MATELPELPELPVLPVGPTAVGDDLVRRRLPIGAPMVVGLVLVGIVVVLSLAASLIAPDPPNRLDLLHALEPPLSSGHLLGTDQFGRDELSRVLYAGHIDLLIAFGVTIVTFTFGTLVGLVAGASGGVVDAVLMRIVDIFFAFPLVVLVLAIVAILGSGLLYVLIAMWLVTWVSYARIVRGQVLLVKHQDYVTAARALGFSRWRTMTRHILPNAVTPAIVYGMIDAVNNVSIGAALGFLGLGVQDPTAEWGKMIANSQDYIRTAWWLAVIPGVAILIIGLGLSIIGDGLADRLRGRGS